MNFTGYNYNIHNTDKKVPNLPQNHYAVVLYNEAWVNNSRTPQPNIYKEPQVAF